MTETVYQPRAKWRKIVKDNYKTFETLRPNHLDAKRQDWKGRPKPS